MQMYSLELKPWIKQEELNTFFFSLFVRGGTRGEGNCFPKTMISWLLVSPSPLLQSCWRAQQGQGSWQAESSKRLLHMCKTFPLGTWKRLIWMAQLVLKWGWVLLSGSWILKGVVLSLWFFPLGYSPQHGRCLNTQLTCWRHLWCSQTIFSPN